MSDDIAGKRHRCDVKGCGYRAVFLAQMKTGDLLRCQRHAPLPNDPNLIKITRARS